MSNMQFVQILDGKRYVRIPEEHKDGSLWDVDGVRHIQLWGTGELVPLPPTRGLLKVVPKDAPAGRGE